VLIVYYGQGAAAGGYISIPAINPYLPWFSLVLLVGILIDIVILWHGEWRTSTRIAELVSNLFGLLLLGLMIQALTSLLNAAGVAGFADGMALIQAGDLASMQLGGMVLLRFVLIVAFTLTAVDTVVQVVRLVQERLQNDQMDRTSLPTPR
jgi:carbon starvation protein CstA